MSNNIYDILKKMAGLEAPKSTLTESKKSKPDYIDIDKDGDKKEPMKKAVKDKERGAIAEAVARVEQQLAEKYMGFKKTVAAIKKGGSADNPEAVAASIGRKKYGKEKFQKAAAAGKKLKEADYSVFALDKVGQPVRGPRAQVEPTNTRGPSRVYGVPPEQRSKYMGNLPAGSEMRFMDDPKKGEKWPSTEQDALKRSEVHTTFEPSSGDKRFLQKDPSMLGKLKQTVGIDEDEYNEDTLSPKQKQFAKLAPPPDKITYADKIAGAKQSKMKEGLPGVSSPEEIATRQQTADISRRLSDKKLGDESKQRIEKQYDADRSSREKLAKIGQLEKYKIGMPPEDVDYMVSRTEKKSSTMKEGWDEMQKYLEKKRGPESKGDAGKKAGTRYGGSAQRDDSEDIDGEGQPAVKKKGRPKGTGGGAKFSFKKPKD